MLGSINQTLHSLNFGSEPGKIPQKMVDQFDSVKSRYYRESSGEWYTTILPGQSIRTYTVSKNEIAEIVENEIYASSLPRRMETIANLPPELPTLWHYQIGVRRCGELFDDIWRAAYVNPVLALKSFKSLKNENNYSAERGWGDYATGGDAFTPYGQLRAAAIELKLGTQEGPGFFEWLKNKYFNTDYNGWLRPPNKTLRSCDQLMGVYAELQFDPESASKWYSDLKNTNLYDRNHHQWLERMDFYEIKEYERSVDDLLLSLLIEIELAKKLNIQPELTESVLPQRRNF